MCFETPFNTESRQRMNRDTAALRCLGSFCASTVMLPELPSVQFFQDLSSNIRLLK